MTDPLARLLDAGFTPDELRGIANDLKFGVVVAEGTGESVSLPASSAVEWTPEKRAAWNEAVGEFLGRVRGSEE